MKVKIRINLTGGIVFLLFSIAFAILSVTQIQSGDVMKVSVDAKFMPFIVAGFMGVLSVILLVQSLVLHTDKMVELDLKEEGRTFGFILIVLAYIVLMGFIGFIIASILMCSALLLYFKCRNWKYYLICAGVVLLAYLLFAEVLNVRFP